MSAHPSSSEPAQSVPDAVWNALGAAHEVDAMFDGKPGAWTFGDEPITDEVAGPLLSLHDFLNDVTNAHALTGKE